MSWMRRILVFSRLLFLVLVFFSFCLLLSSRAGELHTVWEFMNALFTPVFFATTLLLVVIVVSSERILYKLVFVMLYSFVARSFSAVILPAGPLGSQQSVLGVTRLIYGGVIFHGWGGDVDNVFLRVFNWFDRPNFQSGYTIMFARMLGVDIFWVHLFLMPVLWGVFVPVLAFLVGRTLGLSDRVAVLSGLLASGFPLLVFWGAVSVPMGLGYLFFLGSLYFSIRYLRQGGSGLVVWMVVFAFASFLSHFLSGVMALGFLVLALSLKRYEVDKAGSPFGARALLLISFVFAVAVLPLVLSYLYLVSPSNVYFSLDNMGDLSPLELVGLFLFGQYVNYDPSTALVHAAGPFIGLAGLVYALYSSRKGGYFSGERVLVLFLSLGFLVAFLDYRILKLFAVNLPFSEERVWVFRDFVVFPFAAFVVSAVAEFRSKWFLGVRTKSLKAAFRSILRVGLSIFVLVLVAGLILASVFSVYPSFGPLQITSYELETVRYLETVSNGSYVVIGDQFIASAGGMIVGVNNPRAYYFGSSDVVGLEFFNEMKVNPSVDVMVSALDYANVSIAYFVVDRPRLGEVEFERVVSAAVDNGLQALPVSFGDGKVVVFRYERF